MRTSDVRPTAELYAHPRVLANYTAAERAKIVRLLILRVRSQIRDIFMQRDNERSVICVKNRSTKINDKNVDADTYKLMLFRCNYAHSR